LGKVAPSHLLDRAAHPFATLQASGQPDANGDIAFDDEPCAPVPSPAAGEPRHAAGVQWLRTVGLGEDADPCA
jgi:tRNA 2-thiocytidine biosynthesis protein TtcA